VFFSTLEEGMEFKGKGHKFKCIPPVLGIKSDYDNYLINKELAEKNNGEMPEEVKPVIITLTGVSQPEMDKQQGKQQEISATYTLNERIEKITEITVDLVRDHFEGVENLEVGGTQINTFDSFYKEAPMELVQWVMMAVMSTEILTAAEVKNY
jgi:hypothetical protein